MQSLEISNKPKNQPNKQKTTTIFSYIQNSTGPWGQLQSKWSNTSNTTSARYCMCKHKMHKLKQGQFSMCTIFWKVFNKICMTIAVRYIYIYIHIQYFSLGKMTGNRIASSNLELLLASPKPVCTEVHCLYIYKCTYCILVYTYNSIPL